MKYMLTNNLCVLFSLLLLFVEFNAAAVSPVLLWGSKTTDNLSIGLRTIEPSEFASEAIVPLLHNHMIIVYLEYNLKPHDFKCTLPKIELSCYKYLRQVQPKTYYLQVNNPLQSLGSYAATNTLYQNSVLQFPLECIKGRLHVISFNNTNHGERYEQLQQHDFVMSTLSRRLRSCRVVYLYMSSPEFNHAYDKTILKSKSRFKRDEEDEEDEENEEIPTEKTPNKHSSSPSFHVQTIKSANGVEMQYVRDKKFALVYQKLFYAPNLISSSELGNISDSFEYLQVTAVNTQILEEKDLYIVTLTLNTSKNIKLLLEKSGGYLKVQKIEYKKEFYIPSRVGGQINIPEAFSYYCRNLAFVNSKYIEDTLSLRAISWMRMQFQLITKKLKKKKEDGFKSFGEEDDNENATDEPKDNVNEVGAYENKYEKHEEEDFAKEIFRFDTAWDCDGFLSIGLIMTLSLIFVFVAFVTFGIAKLVDIKAVDRFDDPNNSTDF